ncbi:hypothetical protein PVK06_002720 [Gossypium arboreum]|uniref:Uncharacterized protein n=1 Tax=Gossypium arboreum TaxID=29729 RepID=A0ABR0R4B1_GOSAR|nr:hypothetical protein PVK06_002720 [Gossypium arboreum]
MKGTRVRFNTCVNSETNSAEKGLVEKRNVAKSRKVRRGREYGKMVASGPQKRANGKGRSVPGTGANRRHVDLGVRVELLSCRL